MQTQVSILCHYPLIFKLDNVPTWKAKRDSFCEGFGNKIIAFYHSLVYNKKYELTAIYLSGRFFGKIRAAGKGGSITHVFVINARLVITGPTGTVNEWMFSQLLIVSSISMYCC